MWHYQAPLRDMHFILEHWLQAPQAWSQMPAFEALDLPLAFQVLGEAGRFSAAQWQWRSPGLPLRQWPGQHAGRFCPGLPGIRRRWLAGIGL